MGPVDVVEQGTGLPSAFPLVPEQHGSGDTPATTPALQLALLLPREAVSSLCFQALHLFFLSRSLQTGLS